MRYAVLVALFFGAAACTGGPVCGDFAVSPLPKEIMPCEGKPFVFSRHTAIAAPEELRSTATFLADALEEATGSRPALSAKGKIVLSIDPTLPEEGYRIDCRENRILLAGGSDKGVFYGVQTLYKALPVAPEGRPALPAAIVSDAPAYPYRGFLVDVARHFFSVEYLEEVIDILALHGVNVFHWHLTEDQGWRIPVPGYPRLTEVGSHRSRSILEPGSTQYDTIPVQGFYTREEMERLVRYAAERHVTIIPEIDMPGHMLAALASYPELGCTGGPYAVAERFGVFEDVLCPGKDATLAFAAAVLEEVMDVFPSEYVHLGGDECPKSRWRTCPDCQARIRALGLKDLPGKRNRIIAGMADAVIVVESRLKGGSLITADIAFSYNRDLFAFPGRPSDHRLPHPALLFQQSALEPADRTRKRGAGVRFRTGSRHAYAGGTGTDRRRRRLHLDRMGGRFHEIGMGAAPSPRRPLRTPVGRGEGPRRLPPPAAQNDAAVRPSRMELEGRQRRSLGGDRVIAALFRTFAKKGF